MATTCKLIAKVTLGSNAANASFTSIPSTGYTDLLLVCSARSTGASIAQDYVEFRFNGTGTTNLSSRYLHGSGSAAFSGSSASAVTVYGIPASTATANTFGSTEVYIPNYAGSTNKSVSITSLGENNATAAATGCAAGLWSSTDAINSIYIYASSGNLASGSSFFLYGITKA